MKRALEGAYVLHFGKLFETLMAQPSDIYAFERFTKGVERMNEIYGSIEELWDQ